VKRKENTKERMKISLLVLLWICGLVFGLTQDDQAKRQEIKKVIEGYYATRFTPPIIGDNNCYIVAKNGVKSYLGDLATSTEPKEVVIVGAGVAGLIAAYVIQREFPNIAVSIIEAQGRPGGRIYTERNFFNDGLYAEIGAMRIPDEHLCVLQWVEYFNLTTQPFINENPNAFAYVDGQQFRMSAVDKNPDIMGFPINPNESGKTADVLVAQLLAPLINTLMNATNPEQAWETLAAQYDTYSVYEFLKVNGYSDGAIEMIGIMDNLEGTISTSVLELLRDYFTLGLATRTYFTIVGGMDQFPNAIAAELSDSIYFNTQALGIFETPSGVSIVAENTITGHLYNFTANVALITVPFSILAHWDVQPPFSRGKQKAIREMHYDSSTKIYLQFRERFWESQGIISGRSITTLASRFIYYPITSDTTSRGIILGSYTWGNDARKWGYLDESEAIAYVLSDLALVHGLSYDQVLDVFESGFVWDWDNFSYSGGAFALFDPGQLSSIYPSVASPEWNNKVFFAGEHISLDHAWILGAINSATQAVINIVKS